MDPPSSIEMKKLLDVIIETLTDTAVWIGSRNAATTSDLSRAGIRNLRVPTFSGWSSFFDCRPKNRCPDITSTFKTS